VPNIEAGIKRIREFCLPLESKRMQSAGYPGSVVSEILILESDTVLHRKMTLVLVNERLGF
jgi:hypothetical protein